MGGGGLEENLGEDGTKDSWRVECRLLNCTLLLLPPAISPKPVYAPTSTHPYKYFLVLSKCTCSKALGRHQYKFEIKF